MASPDQKQILLSTTNGPLALWEPITGETLGDVEVQDLFWDQIGFSPDGKFCAVTGMDRCQVLKTDGWSVAKNLSEPFNGGNLKCVSSPYFTRDGRFLLVHQVEGGLKAYEAQNWSMAKLPDYVPARTAAFSESPSARWAVG